MRPICLPLTVFAVAAVLAGCAADKQWMKVGESYTTAEFRRDYTECSAKSKTGTVDDDCMRARGWVDVKPSKGDRAADSPATPSSENYRQKSTGIGTTR
jgi:hypothetical protein